MFSLFDGNTHSDGCLHVWITVLPGNHDRVVSLSKTACSRLMNVEIGPAQVKMDVTLL